MRIVVLGAGAVGSLFGARLARAGHSVLLVGRADHVARIRSSGLIVRDHGEEIYRVEARVALPPGAAADAAFLAVKTFDLERAATALARAHPTPVPTLLAQNGLGVEALAHPALAAGGWAEPERWTVRAVHSVPATWIGPGVVREAGSGEVLFPEPGPPRDGADPARTWRALLEEAGFAVRVVPQFEREVWRKALVNAAINPVTALRGVPNGALLEGAAHTEALTLLAEARVAAGAAGFRFSEAEAVRDFERIARATASNRSSMLQDLDRGRPTEIDAISGEILRVAGSHGIDLPATRAAHDAIRRRATQSRGTTQPS